MLDKLTNLTVLNLSNTGVSYNWVSKFKSDFNLHSLSGNSLSMQRDFTNTPHIDKLVNLTGKIQGSCNTGNEARVSWEWDYSGMGVRLE